MPFMKEWATDEIPENVDTSPALIKEAQQRRRRNPLDNSTYETRCCLRSDDDGEVDYEVAGKSHPNRQEALVLLQCHQGRRIYRETTARG